VEELKRKTKKGKNQKRKSRERERVECKGKTEPPDRGRKRGEGRRVRRGVRRERCRETGEKKRNRMACSSLQQTAHASPTRGR